MTMKKMLLFAAAAALMTTTASAQPPAGCAKGLDHHTLKPLQKRIRINLVGARV